jgi:hypothetical protein
MPFVPDRNCTHLAGEYFVAAELYKRGYSVAITIGNAKAIDLYAERGTKTVNIQVKAIRVKKNVGWPIMKNKIVPNVIYVFVCLNEPGTQPSYFILTSREAKIKVKQYKTRGIIDLNTVKSVKYKENWKKIEKALKK